MNPTQPVLFERVLRSAWGRWALAGALVVTVSLAMTAPRVELLELRGEEVAPFDIFLDEFLRWGIWGVAAWPILGIARWILTRSGSWPLLLLVQLPLSGVISFGYLEVDHWLHRRTQGENVGVPDGGGRRGDDRPGADEFDRTQPGRRGPDGRPQRQGNFDGSPEERGAGGGPRGPGRPLEDGQAGSEDPDRPRGRAAERRARMRGRGEAPSWESPFWRFRWIQTIFVYWIVLGLGAGVQAFLGLRDKERRAGELELGAERLRTQLARAQLDTLRGQLNPHFLFNALHSVGGLVRAGEEQLAIKTLTAIGDLLRATLEYGDQGEVTLDEELRVAERYLEIERIRLGERLVLEIDAQPGIGGARVPALLLLPLVENAVRHGIAPLLEGGHVRVQARREGPSLILEVEDDGVGFPPEVLAKQEASATAGRKSIGLENTRGRLLGLYGDTQHFELTNREPRGAGVRVVLPYHEDEWQPEESMT